MCVCVCVYHIAAAAREQADAGHVCGEVCAPLYLSLCPCGSSSFSARSLLLCISRSVCLALSQFVFSLSLSLSPTQSHISKQT